MEYNYLKRLEHRVLENTYVKCKVDMSLSDEMK